MKALWHSIVVPAMLVSASPATGQNAYDVDSLSTFREGREEALLAEDGWFTVAGLHFLSPGESRFGSDPLAEPRVVRAPDAGEKRYFAEATSAAAVLRS